MFFWICFTGFVLLQHFRPITLSLFTPKSGAQHHVHNVSWYSINRKNVVSDKQIHNNNSARVRGAYLDFLQYYFMFPTYIEIIRILHLNKNYIILFFLVNILNCIIKNTCLDLLTYQCQIFVENDSLKKHEKFYVIRRFCRYILASSSISPNYYQRFATYELVI